MIRISTKNLIKTYPMGGGTNTILHGISLDIYDGEFVAITGASGSGKSTLMNLLGCLDSPTSGSYCIDNQQVANLNRQELAHIRNKKIGFIFQKFNLLPDLTALQNVALPQLYAGIDEAQAIKTAQELLTSVGLEHRTNHYPYQLSGGQQQRVAIARALINNPTVLLADEPTGNLDFKSGMIILEMLKELNTSKKATMIIVTHEPKVAEQAHRVITLQDGCIISDTTK